MTKELDRRFRHVGRIKRSWGTTHKPTIRRLEEMMDGLYARGRLDILRAIQSGQYSPLQVYDAWRVNDLERLPTAATLAPLKESMEKWIAKKECSESHRRSLMQSTRHLLSVMPRNTFAVGDIPSLLGTLREKMQGKHPRSFNLARAAAQAFAKTTAGRNSKLWSDISQVEVLRVTPQRRKHPLTPAEFFAIKKRMAFNYGESAWGMVITGMGPTEFWGSWEVRTDRIVIHGTKRSGRERFVPNFCGALPGPATGYAAFRRALRDASDGQVAPYDLRRTYANWLEASGIPRTRRKLYMGHGARDVTDLYERHEVEQFLEADGVKLLNHIIGATENTGLRLEKA